MKKLPTILTLLCTNLVWGSAPHAMENQLVLDKKMEDGRAKILVLTPSGLAKAKALQESYDQQRERRGILFSDTPTSTEDDEDPDLAETIRLSTEGSTPSPISPTSTIDNEDDDPELKQALLKSAQEYEARQKKLDAEREYQEKERARKRRDEVLKELQGERDIQRALREELYAKTTKLEEQRTRLRESIAPLSGNSSTQDEELKNKALIDNEISALSDQLFPLYDQLYLLYPIDTLMHEEYMRLLGGGEPREFPWRQQASSSPLLSAANSTLPQIPSSALPDLNTLGK